MPALQRLAAALIVPLALGAGAREAPAAGLLDQPPREVVFRLDAPRPASVDLLLPFRDASVERLGPLTLYKSSRWGKWTSEPWQELRWGGEGEPEPVAELELAAPIADAFEVEPLDPLPYVPLLRDRSWVSRAGPEPFVGGFDFTGASVATNGFEAIFKLPPTKPVVDWRCRRKPVKFVRYGGESDFIDLVRCDGSMADGALDKLSILARPPEVARPDELPLEPDASSWRERREWLPGVRIVHPRLVWALQRIADAFPGKAVYVYSGYRPLAEVNDGTGHKSLHAEGRAIDISVMRVPNEQLFEACKELKDVGCGFYPHGKFVHLSVRRAHSGKAAWVDASLPGEPAKYVETWPGLEGVGATPK